MTELIIIFGALILLAGIVILVNPELVFGFLRNNSNKIELYILTIVIRLVLGVLLIYQSGQSKFPFAIEIIGWLSIVAAIFLTAIGRNNFSRFMNWAMSLVKSYGRFGGVIASTFGAFLIYAFV